MEDCPTCCKRCFPDERKTDLGDRMMIEIVHAKCGYVFGFMFLPKSPPAPPRPTPSGTPSPKPNDADWKKALEEEDASG